MRLLMLFRLRHLIHVANFVLTALNCICFHPTDWLTDYALKIHIENSQLLCDDWFSLFSLCTEKVYRLFRVIVNGREVSAYVSSEQLCACVHACVRACVRAFGLFVSLWLVSCHLNGAVSSDMNSIVHFPLVRYFSGADETVIFLH